MAELDSDIDNLGIDTLGTAPISEAAPAGASARYEPEFERIEDEIAKLEAVNGTPVDWRVVVDEGLTILRGKSKDLLIASFLCRGLLEVHGYPGLGAGLKIVRDMSEHFWSGLFPEAKRPRARAAAAGWLAERLTGAIGRKAPAAADREPIAACLAALEALASNLDAKLAEQSPNFGDLRRALQAHMDALPAPTPPAAPGPPDALAGDPMPATPSDPAAATSTPTPADTPGPTPAPAASPGAPDDIAGDQDLQKAFRAGREILRKAAQYLRAKNPASATPYVLMRQAAWLGIEQPPPDRDGVSALREVAAERIAVLDGLAKAGKHAESIEQIETTVARAPFWLDGHRMAAAALEALGHDAARGAVIGSLAEFLGRFPTLLDLRFANQAPFADDLTRAWIAGEVLSGAGTPETAPSADGAPDGKAPWIEAAREARKLATKGKIQAALGLLQAGRRQAATARERFLWALEQARLCQAAGRNDLAVPQLEYLDEQALHFRLEEWEPRLSLEIAALLLSCYKNPASKEKTTPESAARMVQLRARIVRLDILSAVEPGQK